MILDLATALPLSIPSPSEGTWYLGPLPLRGYALSIILGIVVGIVIAERRWVARGGTAGEIQDLAIWGVPFSIVGGRLDHLVGSEGQVLDALQELTRLAVYRQTGERSRLMLDIAGYREGRRVALREEAAGAVAAIRDGAERIELDPMTAFERKIVHDAVAEAGLRSESEGDEPRRFVVVLPAGA